MRTRWRGGPALLLAGVAAAAWAAPGGVGDQLCVTPTRVVLEGRKRAAELLLINGGAEPATYRLSFVHLDMAEDGRIRPRDPRAVGQDAEPLLRFSPRVVTLAPGAAQTVRLQVRKPETLADGEYRSHLLFRAVPADPPAPAELQPGQLTMDIRAIFGISIPVLIRHGQVQARCALADLALDQGQLACSLLREGNRSVYGDLAATWRPRRGGAAPAGRMNGVAVYAERDRLRLKLKLAPPPGPGPGTLHVAFLEHGTAKVLAEAALDVP